MEVQESTEERDARCLAALQERGVAAGEEFAELVKAYRDFMRSVIIRRVGTDTDDVDEALGAAVAYLWEKLAAERREVTNVKGYFANAAKWRGVDELRRIHDPRFVSEGSLNNPDEDEEVNYFEDTLAVDRGGFLVMDEGHAHNGMPLAGSLHDLSEGLEERDTIIFIYQIIEDFPAKRQDALRALCSGDTHADVAEAYGIAVPTLYRWWSEFKDRVVADPDVDYWSGRT